MNKGALVGASIGVIAIAAFTTGYYVLRPAAEQYVTPLVEQKLNDALNGTVSYDSLTIDWNGKIVLRNIVIKDKASKTVLDAPEIDVSLSVIEAAKIALTGADALQIISSVEIVKPQAFVWENQDKTWNVNHLLKTTSTESEMGFRGDIIVKSGTLEVTTADAKKLVSTDINGALKFTKYPEITGAATAKINGDTIQAKGVYTKGSNTNFGAFVKTEKLDLTALKQFIPTDIKATLSSGVLSNTAVTVKKNGDRLSLEGSALVENVQGIYNQYTIDKGTVNVSFNGSNVDVKSASALVNGQQIVAAGISDISKEDYTINGSVSLRNADIKALLPEEDVVGVINTTAKITGTLKNPIAEGKGNATGVSYKGVSVDKGSLEYSYNQNVVQLSDVAVTTGSGQVNGNGWYNLKTNAFEAYVKGRALELSEFSALLGETVSGTVEGSATVAGENGKLTSVVAGIHGDNISVNGIETSTVDALINGSGETYSIPYLNATIGDGAVTAYGTVGMDSANLRFNAYQLPMSLMENLVDVKSTGALNISGSFEGEYTNPTIRFHFGSDKGSVHGVEFNSAYGEGEIDNHVLRLDKTIVGGDKGDYELVGKVNLTDNHEIDANLNINEVRLESIAKGFTDIPMTGWLSTNVHIGGSTIYPEIAGSIKLHDGSVYGELVTDAVANFAYGDNRLDVTDFSVKAYDSEIVGYGHMIGDGLNFTLTGKNIDMERIVRSQTTKVGGYADVDGTITGTTNHPIFNGNLHSDNISVNDVALTKIDGKVYADPTVVNLQNLYFTQGKGHYQAHGGMNLDSKQLFGFAQVVDGELERIIQFAKVPVYNLDGALSGRIDFGGTMDNPNINITGSVKDTAIKGVITGNSEIEASLAQRKINISKLQIPMQNGFLAAQGTADLDGEANLQVVANDVPIELLMPLIGDQDYGLTGNFAATINITGKTQNPETQIAASLDNINYNGVTMDHIYALATMKDRMININQIMAERGAYKATVQGKVPWAAFFNKNDLLNGENQNIDLTVDMSAADLAVIPLFAPKLVKDGVGDLDGKIRVTGPLDNIQANGTLSVKDGALTFADAEKPLNAINGTLVFNGQTAVLDMAAQMGKGTTTVKGNADWNNGTLHSYDVGIDMKGLEIINPYFTGPLSGAFKYEWNGTYPKLTGQVDLTDVRVDVPLSLGTSENSSRILLDVTVNAGKNVRLYNSLLYDLMISGSAHFGGTTLRPHPSGRFVVDKGTLKYLNTRFRMLEGSADFVVPGSFMPTLNVKAETDLQNYRISLALNGPVEQMDLTMSSSPYLTEQQIISLLTLKTTGANGSGLSSESAGALMTAGLEMALFGSVESTMQDYLGIDTINISSNYLDPYKIRSQGNTGTTENYYSLEVGKYIIPDLMVTAGTGLNYRLSKFGLQYYVGQNYNINTWVTSNDNYYVGGQWRYRF